MGNLLTSSSGKSTGSQDWKQTPGNQVFLVAKYDYDYSHIWRLQSPSPGQELKLNEKERLILLDDTKHRKWCFVLNSENQSGFVPSSYVKKKKPPIFDSIENNFIRRSESKTNLSSSSDSPIGAKAIYINIDGSSSDYSKEESPLAGPSTATHICFVLVKYDYEAQQSDELSLVKGTRVRILQKSSDGWWRGELGGLFGWFPSNFVMIQEPRHRIWLGLSPSPEPRTTSRSADTKPLLPHPSNGHKTMSVTPSFQPPLQTL